MADSRHLADEVPSPCIRNCCLDGNDVCLGCFRTIDEIMQWNEAGPDGRRAILARCRLRRSARRGRDPAPPAT